MLWAGFVFGLLSSLHCVGMCGPIALALPGAGPGRGRALAGRLLYHLGRLSTYTGLGLGAGLLGHGLRLAGWQQGLSLAAGGLVLLLVAVPEARQQRLAAALGLAGGLRWVKNGLSYFYRRPSLGALYATGLLNGLLPCGMVYVALAGALAMPGVAGSVSYMALFGLGTLPLLLGLSLTGQLVPLAWRGRLRRAGPALALVLAALFMVRGLGLGVPYLSPRLSGGEAAAPAGRQPATMHYCGAPAEAAP